MFVGPSYTLSTRKAAIDKSVNLFLVKLETPGKVQWILDSMPGRSLFGTAGSAYRWAIEVGERAFVVAGSTLFEVDSAGTHTARGSLSTSSGPVGMSYGLFQLVIVDGANGYVLNLSTNVFQKITDPDFPGSYSVKFLDNYFLFIHPETQQAFIAAINDATNFDALDFASAESSPDNLVSQAVVNEKWLQFGQLTTEQWRDTGATDYPFERMQGATLEVGCCAPFSVQEIDGSAFWIGRDRNGSGMVYRYAGGSALRISNDNVERELQESTDISSATSMAWQRNGKTYYSIKAPGLKSTWVYEVKSSSWFEMCELDADGQLKQDRAEVHLHAFGNHYFGGSDGKLGKLDDSVYTILGDPLVRMRISPHEAIPGRKRQFFHAFYLDCTTGEAPQGEDPQVELSYSNDSGATWSEPRLRSIGRVGERFARVLWAMLGSARDRVRKVRFTGNAPFSIIDAGDDAEQGTN